MTDARQAVIVGVGLIGGSVGLALRAEGWHVVGVDLDAGRLADAVDRGVIDEIGSLDSAGRCFGVVATPADSVAELHNASSMRVSPR